MTRSPLKRVTGADLAAQIAPDTAALPAAVSVRPMPSETSRPLPVVQINFKASEEMAMLLAREGEKAGSTRRFLARLLREAGYEVPDGDVSPPDNRRGRSRLGG